MKKRILFIGLILLVLGCSLPDAPVETVFDGYLVDSKEVRTGETVQISLGLKDNGAGGVFSFLWEASDGTIEDGAQKEITWTAPDVEGSVTFSVVITNERGESFIPETLILRVVNPVEEPVERTFVFQSTSGGSVLLPVDNSKVVMEGDSFAIAASPEEGYGFVRWEVVGDSVSILENPGSSATLLTASKSDAVIRAVFAAVQPPEPTPEPSLEPSPEPSQGPTPEPVLYTLRFSVWDGGGEILLPVENIIKKKAGDTVFLSAKADPGYIFLEWRLYSGVVAGFDDAAAINTTLTTAASDVVIYAVFQKIVEFADSRLEDSIRLLINKPSGYIYPENVSGITQLDLSIKKITDLSGLEYFTSLTNLRMAGNQISDLTPLSGLTSLTDLNMSMNQIRDLTPLSGLTGLKDLNLWSNDIKDISPLLGLTYLEKLDVKSNPLNEEAYKTVIPDLEERGVRVYYNVPV